MQNAIFYLMPFVAARIYSVALNLNSFQSSLDYVLLMRGLLSDLAIGGILFLSVESVTRKKAVLYPIWGALFVIAGLNVEHVSVLGSNAAFQYAGLGLAQEFIFGSVFTARNLVHILICAAASISIAAIGGRMIKSQSRRRWAAVTALSVVLIALIPVNISSSYWIQMNLFEENARKALGGQAFEALPFRPWQEMGTGFFKRDLSGQEAVPFPEKRLNVLLVLVEGLTRDLANSASMPELRRIASEHVSYSNAIGLQHQTNRGLYSIICGDYPNLLTTEAKSDFVAAIGPLKTCLPEAMRRSGYRTVFMQGARLGFMSKDRLAHNSGFQEAIGYEELPGRKSYTSWGADDMTLYNNALQKIRELSRQKDPWFLTLLTVGTHHPYVVPGRPSPSAEEAIAFADRALGEFIGAAQLLGIMKDTLVIITSDEASLLPSGGDRLPYGLGRSLVPLVVMSPEISGPRVLDGTFTQADIALSVLDYVGIEDGDFFGRSIFRDYGSGGDSGRDVMFGNVFSSRIYAIQNGTTLYVCSRDLECSAYRPPEGGQVFSDETGPAAADPAFIQALRDSVRANEWQWKSLKTDYLYRETGTENRGGRMLIGDFKISPARGDRITWKLSIKAQSDITVGFTINKHNVEQSVNKRDVVWNDQRKVESGGEYDFEYDYTVPSDSTSIATFASVLAPEDGRYRVNELSIKWERTKDR